MPERPFSQVRRLWVGLSILHLSLVIHLVYYAAFLAQQRSRSFQLLALGIIVEVIAVIAFTLWLTPGHLALIRRVMFRWRWPVVVASLSALAVLGLEIRPEWFYAHLAVTLAAGCALIYDTLYPETTHPARWRIIGAAGVVLGLLVIFIRIRGLSYYPPVDFTDEPWILGWIVGYLRTGHIYDRIMFNGGGLDLPYLYIPVARWMQLVGVDLWSGRLFMFALALLAIVFSALAAHNLYDRTTALFTGLALFSSAVLMLGARLRHDVGLGVAIAASLYLYSAGVKRQQKRWHFLAGLVIGLGWFAHYHAILFGPALAAGLYGPRYLRRLHEGNWRPESELGLFILGGLLGGAVVVLVQLLPQLDVLLRRQPRTSRNLSRMLNAMLGHLANIGAHSKLEFLLVAAGFIAAIRRRLPADWSLLIILVIGHIGLGVIAISPFDYYVVPLAPVYGMLIGSLFGRVGKQPMQLKPFQLVACVCFLLPNLVLSTPIEPFVQAADLHLPAPAAAQWVLDHVSTSATIVGEHYYYLWLHDYAFYSPLSPSVLGSDERVQIASVAGFWKDANVDVFIFDPNLANYGGLEPLREGSFLEDNHYELVATFPGPRADIEIYERLRDG